MYYKCKSQEAVMNVESLFTRKEKYRNWGGGGYRVVLT